MTPRQRVLAALGVIAVALVAALVVLIVLQERQPIGEPGDPRAFNSIESLDATRTRSLDRLPSGLAVQPAARSLTTRSFSVQAAMTDIRALEGFGVREGGSDAERRAAEYLRDKLAALGLKARIEEFPLTNGATSRNVVARIDGSSDAVVVLGAHMDSKPPSPGANDNASGCAAVLEIARSLAEYPAVPTVEIVFFGSEEIIGGDPDAHHFGSRYRVSRMSAAERAATAGMLSVDMIGYGPDFHTRTMRRAPMTLNDMLLEHAGTLGIGITFKPDTSRTGLSDHEAYEKAGIPAVAVAWREDPVYHSAADVSTHLQQDRIEKTGRLVLSFVRSLDAEGLNRLTSR
jgi:Zn-dependent M28 family amino/carboxypeptidase